MCLGKSLESGKESRLSVRLEQLEDSGRFGGGICLPIGCLPTCLKKAQQKHGTFSNDSRYGPTVIYVPKVVSKIVAEVGKLCLRQDAKAEGAERL